MSAAPSLDVPPRPARSRPRPSRFRRSGGPSGSRTLPWRGYGLANVAVSLAPAVLAWWLLVDPHAVNIAVRIAVMFVLGALTFLAYYVVLAAAVLDEPVVVGSMHGDALGFVDWAVLWMLRYVLFLGSYGLPRPQEQATA